MKQNFFKILLMVFVISLFTNKLFSQGSYVHINTGYGLNMSSQNLSYFDFYNYSGDSNTSTIEQVNISLGKGLNFGGAFGYMFNKNIGAELGVSYLLGSKMKVKKIYNSDDISDRSLSSKMLRVNPSLVIASGFERINPYAKFGMIIGSASVIFDYNQKYNGNIEKRKIKLDGGLAIGLNAAIGANYKISDKMSLFAEVNMVNMSYAPTKGEVIEATYNGVDELSDMTIREKEIEFVDTYIHGNSSPSSQPRKQLKQKLPFGSFGINFGLRMGL